jgi:hypothetical protein
MSGKRVLRRDRSGLVPMLTVAVATTAALTWGMASLDGGPERAGGALDEADRSTPSTIEPGATPSASEAPTTAASPPASASPATPARRSGRVAEVPEQIRLPSGTTVEVLAVGTRPDGVLDVPDDIRKAGWWRGGSRLADPFGPTVIAAHIDSQTQGLGPYVELLRVRRGDEIVVRSAHLVERFRVSSLRLVPRSSLAGVTDLFSPQGPRRLVMVTCAGPFDESRGGYQNLAIVTARPPGAPDR